MTSRFCEQNSQSLYVRTYDYDDVRAMVKEFLYTAHIKARGEEAQAIKRGSWF